MTDGVSVSEFAREIGISHTMVHRLVKAGKLPQYMDGTIPMEAGLNAYDKYKAEPKNRGGRPAGGGGKRAVKKEAPKQALQKPVIPDTPQEYIPQNPIPNNLSNSERGKEAANINAAMSKASLAEKTFKAKLRELEYKMKTGELLEKNEVAAEAQWLAEQIKSKLLAIPPRISSMCEGRVAREIEEIITDSINNALKELQKCKYTGDKE